MSYNKSLFQGVPKKNVNKTRFNLSHEWKAQIQPGYLYPCLLMETFPNDNWSLNTEFMFRFASLYFPIMHKFTMRCDYFYIPNRILWPGDGLESGWKKWINEQEEAEVPVQNIDMGYASGSFNQMIHQFMGIPMLLDDTGRSTEITNISAFPLSAYLKIYDEYYRIPQLEDELWFPLQAGNNTPGFDAVTQIVSSAGRYHVLTSKWEKDYFTSALPTPQIGEAVLIPSIGEDGVASMLAKADGSGPAGAGFIGASGTGELVDSTTDPITLETQATIKQLRIAEILQSYYERIMKVGQRYRDFIEGLWDIDPEPMSVDVPVLIGSKFGRVQVADVMTQADTTYSETGQARTGDYRGQMNLYSQDGGDYNYHSREHGWIMGILQVNPNTSYGQGIHRMWRRTVQTDYPLDIFSTIGDQEILKEEVFYTNLIVDAAKNQDTFGYIPRHSEAKYQNNIYCGRLAWDQGLSQHAGRHWEPDEVTGTDYDDYIQINTLFTNVGIGSIGGIRATELWRVLPNGSTGIQQPAEGIIYAHIFHSVYVNRALPMYATPRL